MDEKDKNQLLTIIPFEFLLEFMESLLLIFVIY